MLIWGSVFVIGSRLVLFYFFSFNTFNLVSSDAVVCACVIFLALKKWLFPYEYATQCEEDWISSPASVSSIHIWKRYYLRTSKLAKVLVNRWNAYLQMQAHLFVFIETVISFLLLLFQRRKCKFTENSLRFK